jgi:hypothetical protein
VRPTRTAVAVTGSMLAQRGGGGSDRATSY